MSETFPSDLGSGVTVVRRDSVGLVATDGTGFYWYLTPCCLASAKGSMDGVVCRACYDEVSPLLGGVPK